MGIRNRRVRPNRLRVLRAERRMTQFVLAHKSRVATSRISFFENGLAEPKPEELERMARALKVTVHDICPDAEAIAS
jgi:transcriptional regulator with XRE-family HTH domain